MGALCSRPGLTLAQLDRLMKESPHGAELGMLRVGELIEQSRRETFEPRAAFIRPGETPDVAIMRAFRMRGDVWLASGYFRRLLGLPRWTVQKLLGELVENGRLDRRGVTSGVRYRLAKSSEARAPSAKG